MQTCAPLFPLSPLNDIIVDLNKPKIIKDGGELSNLEYLPSKTENVKYLQNTGMCTFDPLSNTIVDLNKPKIIGNSGELSDLDYLPSKQKMWNISRTWTCEPLVSSGPLSHTRIHFKQALNDGE